MSHKGSWKGTAIRATFTMATVLLICLPTLLTGSIKRTSLPLNFVYTPANFSDEDTIKITYSLGDSVNPAGPDTSFMFIHDYSEEGYQVDESSVITASFENSWACEDGNCEVDVYVHRDEKKIYVTVSRLDNEIQSGYGVIVTLEGIIVEIDIVHRMAFHDLERNYQFGKFYFRYETEKIRRVEVLTVSGQMVYSGNFYANEVKMNFYPPNAQVYVIRVFTQSGYFHDKVFLSP
ncbi:MAG: hypothetical protein KDE26_14100 [Bacteroidetes bacterium]|nr:hypothetical protein [Bacteroidota bacterium]